MERLFDVPARFLLSSETNEGRIVERVTTTIGCDQLLSSFGVNTLAVSLSNQFGPSLVYFSARKRRTFYYSSLILMEE
jgi:hypothetical protein